MPDIGRDTLRLLLEHGDIVLIDAQTPGWFEREHLPGAQPASWEHIVDSVRAVAPDPDTHIVTYCGNTTCTGSTVIAEHLRQHG